MSAAPDVTTAITAASAAFGAVLIAVGTALAARPRSPSHGLAWMTVAGAGFAVLGLAAGRLAPDSGGLRAGAAQALAALAAAVLGGLSLGAAREEGEPPGWLASAGLSVAWLSLIGLPPAFGFHARVLVYRSLLAAGWGWLTVFAIAGSAAAIVPGFVALASARPGRARGVRALLIVLLLIALVAFGLNPGPVLALWGASAGV